MRQSKVERGMKQSLRKKQQGYILELLEMMKKSPVSLECSVYKDHNVYSYFMDCGNVPCMHLNIEVKDIKNLVKEAKKGLRLSLGKIKEENVIVSFVYENKLINVPFNKMELWLQKKLELKSQEEASDCNEDIAIEVE